MQTHKNYNVLIKQPQTIDDHQFRKKNVEPGNSNKDFGETALSSDATSFYSRVAD